MDYLIPVITAAVAVLSVAYFLVEFQFPGIKASIRSWLKSATSR